MTLPHLAKSKQTVYVVNGEKFLDLSLAIMKAREVELSNFWSFEENFTEVSSETVVEICLTRSGELTTILTRDYAALFQEVK